MKRSVVLILHTGYWIMYIALLFLLILFLSFPSIQKGAPLPYGQVLLFLSAFAIIPGILAFYIFYSVLYKAFLSKKRILLLILNGILVSIASAILGGVIMTILASFHMGPGLFNDGFNSAYAITIVMSFNTLANGIVGLVMKGFITSYGDIKLKEDLAKKNYEMELALVKSQINPHFLFNTINNIDVMIEKDPAKASSYLNKLSDIMRFMLYETKTEMITLKKDLAYIEKYIELQKIRTSNNNYVNFSVEGDPGDLMIPPMIFLPFIENAFKHAENKKIENAINIFIGIKSNKITFTCENTYSQTPQVNPDKSGLGNDLIAKRLMLLYPKKHTLTISSKNNKYKVDLELLAI